MKISWGTHKSQVRECQGFPVTTFSKVSCFSKVNFVKLNQEGLAVEYCILDFHTHDCHYIEGSRDHTRRPGILGVDIPLKS